ncbi:hypothetical protein [Saccharomonospora piscinae]|uniref:hypothetical protein n=1 Tax=Saccharomonospora piscinae TaxID=687388 RepID=UPI00111C6B6F|nr:hypothetical protein [Saccharomonospora piscinae]
MSTKPPRRRPSKLAGEHPAYPTPAAAVERAPAVAQELVSAPAPERAPEYARTRSPAYARTRARTEDAREARRRAARARTEAKNAAYGWGSARARLDARTRDWVDALRHARELGEAPEVLAGLVHEAAERAAVDVTEIPAEVWHAAGVDTHPPEVSP